MFAIHLNRASARRALLLMLVLLALANTIEADATAKTNVNAKQVIGPTAVVEETESDIAFFARVDTGATTSSLHVEGWEIADEADVMMKNVGKTIRFCIKNKEGESEWLERKIVEISVIKTSEQEEQRYKVRLTLNCLDIQKRVLVSLNDRSHMAYPVLLGRNFLQGDFVVDVDLGERADRDSEVDLRKDQTDRVVLDPKQQTPPKVSPQESQQAQESQPEPEPASESKSSQLKQKKPVEAKESSQSK